MITLRRVVAGYVLAKSVSLVPEFKKALRAYQQGEAEPMRALLKQVCDLILPGGGSTPPSWFNALGTAKRNNLKWLYREGQSLLGDIAPTHPGAIRDVEKWRAYVSMKLEAWGKKLRTLEIASQATDEEREVKRGDFIIVPMPGVSKAETEAALEALDEAASKIRAKFPQVLYGLIFFSTHLSAKTAAHYVPTDDTIHLSVGARKRFDDIYTLIHEFGHRYDRKVLKANIRSEFVYLSTHKEYEKVHFDDKLRSSLAEEAVGIAKARKEKRPFLGMSPELELWAKYHDDLKGVMTSFLVGKIDADKLHAEVKGTKDVEGTTGKVLHEPLSVTPYGATKPSENFAEAFAHYVLGMAMPQPFQDIFAKL